MPVAGHWTHTHGPTFRAQRSVLTIGRSGRVENIHDIMFGGALKTKVLENASTEKASTKQRISQGWKTHVRKTQVRKMQVQCKPSVR